MSEARIIWFFLGLAILVGCSNSTLSVTNPADEAIARRLSPESGRALVYLVRPYAFMNSAVTIPASINDQPFGNVDVKTYIYANVEPGTYYVRASATPAAPAKQVIARAGVTHFFAIDPLYNITELSVEAGRKYVGQFRLSSDRRLTANSNVSIGYRGVEGVRMLG